MTVAEYATKLLDAIQALVATNPIDPEYGACWHCSTHQPALWLCLDWENGGVYENYVCWVEYVYPHAPDCPWMNAIELIGGSATTGHIGYPRYAHEYIIKET